MKPYSFLSLKSLMFRYMYIVDPNLRLFLSLCNHLIKMIKSVFGVFNMMDQESLNHL